MRSQQALGAGRLLNCNLEIRIFLIISVPSLVTGRAANNYPTLFFERLTKMIWWLNNIICNFSGDVMMYLLLMHLQSYIAAEFQVSRSLLDIFVSHFLKHEAVWGLGRLRANIVKLLSLCAPQCQGRVPPIWRLIGHSSDPGPLIGQTAGVSGYWSLTIC